MYSCQRRSFCGKKRSRNKELYCTSCTSSCEQWKVSTTMPLGLLTHLLDGGQLKSVVLQSHLGMMWFIFLFQLLTYLSSAESPVTYGSSIVLRHISTNFKLFSTKMSWGFGSRQQIITTVNEPDYDDNTIWVVKPSHKIGVVDSARTLLPIENGGTYASNSIAAGSSVPCGSVIRLEHMETEKNLHSHKQSAAISGGNYEVSGYGQQGIGDSADNFSVGCSGAYWMINEPITLKHVDLDSFLVTSKRAVFTQSNCPRCPILGHLEVSILKRGTSGGDTTQWKAEVGLLLERLGDDDEVETESSTSKDEL